MGSMILAGLALWMLACAFAGYRARLGLFAVILVAGLALNTAWIVLGLGADPLSPPALSSHLSIVLFAISALGLGWLLGRLVRRFRDSRVDGA